VLIRPLHDTAYRDVLEGWPLLLVFRILAPAFAFWTAGGATSEFMHHQWRAKPPQQPRSSSALVRARTVARHAGWTVRDVIYAVEVPSLALSGALLACGHYGPMVLPLGWHFATLHLFSGASVFTAALLALFIRDEAQHVRTRQPRRPLAAQHPKLLAAGAVACIGSDLLGPLLVALDVETSAFGASFAAAYFLVFVPVQCAVVACFLAQARYFQQPLAFYVYQSARAKRLTVYGDRAPSVLRVGRLVFWLACSAACMLLSCYAYGYLVFVMALPQWASERAADANLLIAHAGAFALSRIGISYAQLQAVKPSLCSSSGSGSGNGDACAGQQLPRAVACLAAAAARACDKAPLTRYWAAVQSHRRVLPSYSSETATTPPSGDESGRQRAHRPPSPDRGLPAPSGDEHRTALALTHASTTRDRGVLSRASDDAAPLDGPPGSDGVSPGSSSGGRVSPLGGSSSGGRLSLRGALRAPQPKLAKAHTAGRAHRRLRTRGKWPLEPVCEGAAVTGWLARQPQPPSEPLNTRNWPADAALAAPGVSVVPSGKGQAGAVAAAAATAVTYAPTSPAPREERCLLRSAGVSARSSRASNASIICASSRSHSGPATGSEGSGDLEEGIGVGSRSTGVAAAAAKGLLRQPPSSLVERWLRSEDAGPTAVTAVF
jgi:hypothetical protein